MLNSFKNCQVMPAARYFAWGCFRYLGARTFEGEFSNVTRSYAGKGDHASCFETGAER